MDVSAIQQNVAQYLRELADKVEKSYCFVENCTKQRKFVTFYEARGIGENYPTGEREVTLKLNYIEERL